MRLQIEEDEQENEVNEDDINALRSPGMDIVSPASYASQDSQEKVRSSRTHNCNRVPLTSYQPSKLHTSLPARFRSDSDDAPQSVIHAPTNFKTFVSTLLSPGCTTLPLTVAQNRVSVSAASSHETSSDQTAVVSPQTPEANMIPDDKVRLAHVALTHAVMAEHTQQTSTYTHPIDTTIPPSGAPDRTTPRAQTREDYEQDGKRRSRVSLSLAGMSSITYLHQTSNFSRYR